MQLSLKNNLGFSWYQNERVFIKGYFFDNQNNFFEKENAVKLVSYIKSKHQFLEFINTINGCFTIIIRSNTSCFIACDTTRMFPVFYTYLKDELCISDDISFLKKEHHIQSFNPIAEAELKSALHTYGKKTLLQNVYQIQANEYLIIEEETITKQDFFFTYATSSTSNTNYNDLKKQTFTAFEAAFKRLILSLNNQTVALPLSGGFDSRLIAVMLKKYNYTNVVCYTYGKKDSFEIENSRKTAKALGFAWYFIEYSEKLFGDFSQSTSFINYAHYAGKYSAMPNPQEYFAVQYLTDQKLIPNNTIFIPGYAGDLLGGSQYLKVIPKKLKKEAIVDLITSQKLTSFKLKKVIKKTLKQELQTLVDSNIYANKLPASIFEDIDIKEKIAKYIFNSANFYTFFGYTYRFPFWDKELLSFFKNVPEEYKMGKLLFDDVLTNNYFTPFNVSFENEIQPSIKTVIIQNIKNKIRPFLPTFIKQKLLDKNSWINYKPICIQLENHIKTNKLTIKKQLKSYNEIIVQWYVFLAKEKLK